MPLTDAAGPGTPATAVRARKRTALGGGALVFAAFIAYPILTAFTPVFDGTVAGIGVAYVLGFVEVVFALVVALLYARATNRAERG
jgi:uncharacterized membrane protein (DUF485 family)